MNAKTACAVGFFYLVLLIDALAQSSLDLRALAHDDSVRVGRLSNGFTYYLRTTKFRTIEVRFLVKAGKNHETAEQKDIAHVLEHMPFIRTKSFVNAGILFRKNGLSGNDFNAFTGNAATKYYASIASGKHELLTELIRFYRECAQEIRINKRDIENARVSVLNEVTRNRSKSLAEINSIRVNLIENEQSRTIAAMDNIQSLRTFHRKALRRFFKAWYRPENQALVVVGDFNMDSVEQNVITAFSSLISNRPEAAELLTSNPGHLNRSEIDIYTIPNSTAKLPTLETYSKRQHHSNKSMDDLQRLVLIDLFNELMSVRRSDMMIGDSEVGVSFRYESNVTMLGERVDAVVGRSVFRNSVAESLKEILEECERLKRFGFTANELVLAKKVIAKRINTDNEYSNKHIASKIENNFVYGDAVVHPSLYRDLQLKTIDTIGLRTFNRHVSTLLDFPIGNIVIRKPSGAEVNIITPSDAQALINSADTAKVEPRPNSEPKQSKLFLDVEIITPREVDSLEKGMRGAFIKQKLVKNLDLRIVDLPNGMKFFLKRVPSQSANGVVLNSFVSTPKEVDNLNLFLRKNTATILFKSGFSGIERSKMAAFYLKHGIQFLSPYSSDNIAGFTAKFEAKNFEQVLQILYRFYTKPFVDSCVVNKIVIDLNRQGGVRRKAASQLLLDTLHSIGNSPSRYQLTREEKTAISDSLILQYFKDNFLATKGVSYVIAGDFSPDEYATLIVKYLYHLPSVSPSSSNQIEKDQVEDKDSAKLIVINAESTGSQSLVRLQLKSKFDGSLKNKLVAQITKDYLAVRLVDRLRAEENGTYGVDVSLSMDRDERKLEFIVDFMCMPNDTRRLILCVEDEIRKLKTEEIDESEFLQVIKTSKERFSRNYTSPEFWCLYLTEEIKHDGKLDNILLEKEMYDQLIPVDIIDFFRQYSITVNKYIVNPI